MKAHTGRRCLRWCCCDLEGDFFAVASPNGPSYRTLPVATIILKDNVLSFRNIYRNPSKQVLTNQIVHFRSLSNNLSCSQFRFFLSSVSEPKKKSRKFIAFSTSPIQPILPIFNDFFCIGLLINSSMLALWYHCTNNYDRVDDKESLFFVQSLSPRYTRSDFGFVGIVHSIYTNKKNCCRNRPTLFSKDYAK